MSPIPVPSLQHMVCVHNPEQWDTDLDGAGDACDPDLDGDGVGNLQDNCNGVFNHAQVDLDRDGKGDE